MRSDLAISGLGPGTSADVAASGRVQSFGGPEWRKTQRWQAQSQRIAAVGQGDARRDAHGPDGGHRPSGQHRQLDGVYDCRANRKAIFNRGMVPNINPNPRGRKQPKRGRKAIIDPAIFEERFRTIERVFAWEDKFRRLLLRFERISVLHYAFKTLAYTMINLRHYCQA
jgi:hypothetical protein